ARIHADRSQAQRRMALEGFREGRYRVLVATDIAARGIDVADIGHVINFDLPHVPEDYVHRVGRTARHLASGRASSFASPEELDLLQGIERLTRAKLPRAELPRESSVFQTELARATAAERDPGPNARPAGLNRNRRRAAAHAARRASGGGAAPAKAAAAGSGAPPAPASKPRIVGSWGPKRRR
ncbi:MAG TPA: C-terminal helicase domain-containing protein, partial [Anaeromyxobacteraceae bacterium]|nr:C-terminal helicase domain-containing protein [Anaeromyxobacteraceae bacterium]